MAIKTDGAMSPESIKFLTEIDKRISTLIGDSRDTTRLLQSPFMAIVFRNAFSILPASDLPEWQSFLHIYIAIKYLLKSTQCLAERKLNIV